MARDSGHGPSGPEPEPPKSALELALRYGWPVFPCGPDKKPLTKHGFKDATRDQTQIKRWWTTWPDAMIGVPTGQASGVWVLDIDTDPTRDKEGLASLEALGWSLDDLTRETVVARTATGGWHIYFKWTEDTPVRNSDSRIGRHIDTRGEGGYVIVPGSRLADGRAYVWRNAPGAVDDAPDLVLRAAIAANSQTRPAKPAAPSPRPASAAGSPSAAAALREECWRVAHAAHGERNDTLNRAAFALGQLVGEGGLDEDEVWTELLAAAAGYIADDGEPAARKTIESGLEAGKAKPREPKKPRLLVSINNPDETVAALRDILAEHGELYDRSVPVRLVHHQTKGCAAAQVLTAEVLVMLAHSVCRPFGLKPDKSGKPEEYDTRLPRDMAVMYLSWQGSWKLRPLNGVASSPLLAGDGTIQSSEGYDPASGMWAENVPDLSHLVPERPAKTEAMAALQVLRKAFASFCFADAEMRVDKATGVPVVDTSKDPGKDESGFLAALLTAVCRPSLHLAPGVLLRAASISGAGAGKGLLARCISIIAFGREPHAVTSGGNAEELEKRIAAELIEGSQVLFLDNLNNRAFRSDLLASAITERPARVRILGRSEMLPLNASAFVVLTGNGLTVSEDLARRFPMSVELDPHTEDPEARKFTSDIRLEVTNRRIEFLAAALTIWRWGRQYKSLPTGRALGSFDQWCKWVRDPLLALGCKDPAERVSEAKARDTRRQETAAFFSALWAEYGNRPLGAKDMAEHILEIVDPQKRGRQFQAAKLQQLAGTRMAGFMLTRQAAPGRWGTATYALQETEGHPDAPQPRRPKFGPRGR